MFRNQPLQPHQAGVAEQVRANLALFEIAEEDALHSACQEPGEAGFARRQRQTPEILAVADQDARMWKA